MGTQFKAIANVNNVSKAANISICRKLTAKKEVFELADGDYNGTVIKAFWYNTEDGKTKVMLKIQLKDKDDQNIVFCNPVDDDWIENYPYSELIFQANIEDIKDFEGLKVQFVVRNKKSITGKNFSNIKKISLGQ